MGRIEERFKSLLSQKKKAFIPFFTAFYPNENQFEHILVEADSIGADFIEIGIPYSDPLADGKMIQYSSQWALENGFAFSRLLERLKALRGSVSSPLIVMSYFNSVLQRGLAQFGREVKDAGISGVIVPDLPWEESAVLKKELSYQEIDLIQLVAPTTSSRRIQKICDYSQGFVYLVSLTGVTGVRLDLPKDLVTYVERVRKVYSRPLCVGFGISNARQAQMVSRIADGVIIGSAFINILKDRETDEEAVQDVIQFLQELRNSIV